MANSADPDDRLELSGLQRYPSWSAEMKGLTNLVGCTSLDDVLHEIKWSYYVVFQCYGSWYNIFVQVLSPG